MPFGCFKWMPFGYHLAAFSVDIAFAHHFVGTRPPLTLPSVGVLVVLATPVKLSKMVGNSASYPLNSW